MEYTDFKTDEIIEVTNKGDKGNPYHHTSDGKFGSKEDSLHSAEIEKSLDDVSKETEEDDFFFSLSFDDIELTDERYLDGIKLTDGSIEETTEEMLTNEKCNTLYNLKATQNKRLKNVKTLSDYLPMYWTKESEKKLADTCTDIIQNAIVCCAFPCDKLDDILRSGKIFNQVELERVHGVYGAGHGATGISGMRISVSEDMFGTKFDRTGVSLEKYGFMGNPKISELHSSAALRQYGDTKSSHYGIPRGTYTCLIFDKDKMAEQNVTASYTLYDSLGGQYTPQLITEPFDTKCVTEAAQHRRDISRTYKRKLDDNRLTRISDLSLSGYIEAQLHGLNGDVPITAAYAVYSTTPEYFTSPEGKIRLRNIQNKGLYGLSSKETSEKEVINGKEYLIYKLYKYTYDESTGKINEEEITE